MFILEGAQSLRLPVRVSISGGSVLLPPDVGPTTLKGLVPSSFFRRQPPKIGCCKQATFGFRDQKFESQT